ncbi:hypothetical protein [Isachenkonia alkalipeptolytica]|uniref:Uncharacterized protein n=1 Tax=Isachenkonia alkalipeptolytica TaxID=2565777 RepID=A0AA43XI32_9CLOT|nr:hypothetical protein [Isachenkonia alkalipeptolytica]NBG87197.1 hypothetical protein [Isachenkonia alkalipeptolytica]
MNPFIFAIVTGIIIGVFSFFFEAVNKSVLRPFEPIQRVTGKLKRKKTVYYFSVVIVLLVVLFIVEVYSLNDMGFAMILGFVFAMNNIFFQKGFHEKKEHADMEE